MAKENITKFINKYAADEALREKLNGKSADEVVAVAREQGDEFSKEELAAYRDQVMELNPEQLEKAAGGDSAYVEYLVDSAVDAVRNGIETGVDGIVDGAKWVGQKAADGYNYVADGVVSGYNAVVDFFRGIGSWF